MSKDTIMPKLSVVIPVYNVEKYLSRCLDSVLKQTFTDMEIICVNDGSPDNSAKILSDYASRDSRIRIINQENQGLSAARNTGVAAARGKYIGFVDSDDWIDTDFYSTLINLAETHNADIAMAGTKFTSDFATEKTQSAHEYITSNFIEKLRRMPNGAVWNKIFSLDLLRRHALEFPRGRYFEDNIVLTQAVLFSDKMVFTDSVFYYYYQNASGICKQQSDTAAQKRLTDKFWVSEKLLETFRKYKLNRRELYELKLFIARSVLPEYAYKKNIHTPRVNKILGTRFVMNLRLRRLKKLFWFDYTSRGAHKKRLCGICVYRKNAPFDKDWIAKNIHPFCIDNTNLLNILRGLDKFTYIPNPGNLGDMLIAKATYDFFDANNIKYETIDYSHEHILDTVVYGGGGIWVGDLYENSNYFLDILNRAKRIVILPSSIYDCDRLVNILDKRFTVFARERQTYDYLVSKNTGAQIFLDSDMAFRLAPSSITGGLALEHKDTWQKICKDTSEHTRIIKFMRDDLEKKSNASSDYDLSMAFCSLSMSRREVDSGTKMMLATILSYDKIITDRLHIGIAAMLLGRALEWHDNSYGKVRAVYLHNAADRANVKMISDI